VSHTVVIEAVVQVGAQETRYLRCGRGSAAVVVLAVDADQRLDLLKQHAARYRVVAPVPPVCPTAGRYGPAGTGHPPVVPETAAFEDWMRGVIDGLGLERPSVVLGPDMAWAAVPLTAHFRDELKVVTVVSRDHG
jgi:hypothetical protein